MGGDNNWANKRQEDKINNHMRNDGNEEEVKTSHGTVHLTMLSKVSKNQSRKCVMFLILFYLI